MARTYRCKCLEITCGEAPFITTRYDAESGEFIPLNRRVGVLDRKFQAIQADKNFWAMRAVRSVYVYGYELQPDNLLIARANVLMSFVEFVENFSAAELNEVAEIVTKNFWLTVDNAPKFDFVIGNPPYQDDSGSGDNKNFAKPIYHQLMEATINAADNQKVVVDNPNFKPLSEIVFGRTNYRLSQIFIDENPGAPFLERKNDFLKSNVFSYAADYFFDTKPDDGKDYCQIFGLAQMKRAFKWIRRDYIIPSDDNLNFDKYKIFVPKSFGRSNLGEEAAQLISPPAIGEPNQGCTQTFITVGAFDTRNEAENCLTFIKSKFARVMLGILKVTQDNPASTWAKVPLQNFTADSDIDWSGDVDAQLYRKYNLSDPEINFIESHVKEMD